EKKARLTNSKLRGRTVPREGTDIIKSKIQNALLDFQWDSASDGGTMNAKWGLMDQDTRLFGSCFGLVYWKYEEDKDGKVIFNGNEFKYLDVRDVGLTNGDNVRNANWVQVSEFVTMDELETENTVPGEPKYPGLAELKDAVANDTQDRRDNNYVSRVKSLKGIQDRLGEDKSFPVIEIVTEYRKDKWITFSPKHNILLREIDNPYNHGKIPVVQLKYFPLSDDPWGEAEVESVLSLWRAIQYTLNGYLDTMNIHMKPPLKIIEGAARMETIEWGPEATWIITQANAVTEHSGSAEPLKYFQSTYSALVSAFNTAMGDSSQGIGGVDPFSPDKTATEIRNTQRQQNVRDQDNQNSLSDAIKDMMMMWISNNGQFLFANKEMNEYIMKIVGEREFGFFKRQGLDQEILDQEGTQAIADAVGQLDGDVSDLQLQQMTQAGSIPKFPVIENPEETDPEKIILKPKMRIDETGQEAEISLVPEDLEGLVDYIPDVKSMAAGADVELRQARQQAVDLLLNNAGVQQMLAREGKQPNVLEILKELFEDSGTRDAERFFSDVKQEEAQPQQLPQQQLPAGGLPTQPEIQPQVGGAVPPLTQ
ncbi:hypothetical protein KAR91_80660, partial [Candidatus Pacearchaeota archaeon]|nr:hypothetical protein [Candidatus Pacearchaeota archaeon]